MDNAIPFELWHGCKPDVSHFQVWGLTAYVHIQKDKCDAFKPHYEKCVFIGYPNGYKGWKFYNPTIKHTIISERADFNERHTSALHPYMIHHSKPHNGTMEAPYPYTALDAGDDPADDNPFIALQVLHPERAPEPHEDQDEDPVMLVAASTPLPAISETPPPAPQPAVSPIGIGAHLSQRTQQWPQKWWKLSPAQLVDDSEDFNNKEADIAQYFGATTGHPRTFKEVVQCDNASKWRQAVLNELAAHKLNGTWTLVPCPKNSPIIGSKWVFTKKYQADGFFEYYKGCLVAQSFIQRPGFEYLETFAPTVCLPTL